MSEIKISGHFDITPALTDYDRFYLFNFHATPHLKRNEIKLNNTHGKKYSYNGKYGSEGEFFIKFILDANGNFIDDKSFNIISDIKTIIDSKNPPSSQPSIYCPWKPNKNGDKLIPDNKTFYQGNYNWMKWLLLNFFESRYFLNGEIEVESPDTKRSIVIKNNKISFITRPKDKSEIPKSDKEIIYEIINKTKSKEIEWKKLTTLSGSSFYTFINIKNNIKIKIVTRIEDFKSNKNYINIYLDKRNLVRHIKTIKGYYVNNLIDMIYKINK